MSKKATPTAATKPAAVAVAADADTAEPTNQSSDIGAALEAASLVKKACAALLDRQPVLTTERKALQERNYALYDMPLRREEAKAFVVEYLDAITSRYPEPDKLREFFDAIAKPRGERAPQGKTDRLDRRRHQGPLSLADLQLLEVPGASGGVVSLIGATLFPAQNGRVTLTTAECNFLFGGVIKQLVLKSFDSHFPELQYVPGNTREGLTLDERRQEIESNDARIAAIDQELQAIDAQLDELDPRRHDTRFFAPSRQSMSV